jgi:hypothetical protein
MARRLGLRRDRIEIAHGEATDAPALRRAGTGRGRADIEAQARRRREIDDLPAIDRRREAAGFDAGAFITQRVTTTPFGARSTLTAAFSTSAALPMVDSCTKAR